MKNCDLAVSIWIVLDLLTRFFEVEKNFVSYFPPGPYLFLTSFIDLDSLGIIFASTSTVWFYFRLSLLSCNLSKEDWNYLLVFC